MEFFEERPEGPEILIEEDQSTGGRHRVHLFSRGIMTQSLLRLGMSPQEALRIATDVRERLEDRDVRRIRRSHLHAMILSYLKRLEPKEARYADRLRYLDGSLIVQRACSV